MPDKSFGYCLNGLLAADTGISNVTSNRVTPPPLPPSFSGSSFAPSITSQQISGQDLESLQGYSGLVRTIFQINCWAKDHEDADILRRLVKGVLSGYKGSTPDGIPIAGSNHVGDREFYDGERRLYQKITTFSIWWELD